MFYRLMIKTCHPEDERAYLRGILRGLKAKGNIAEIGVWNGGTAQVIKEEIHDREIHLFDTFEGIMSEHAEENWPTGDYCCYLKDVQKNLGDGFIYHKGDICLTKNEVENEKFSFIHFDLDIYIPLKDSLQFFYDRLNKGGIMLISNYDSAHLGVIRAVDEFKKDYKKYSRYITIWKN